MIWNTTVIMTIVDIAIATIVVIILCLLYRPSDTTSYSKVFKQRRGLISIGLGLFGLFFFTDFLLMYALTLLMSGQEAVQLMAEWQLIYRGVFGLVCLAAVSMALIGVTRGGITDAIVLDNAVAARREIEVDLGISERRFERAVAATNDGLWDWNILTGENYFSRRWAEMLGFRSDEIESVLDTFTDLLHPDDKQRVERLTKEHLQSKKPYDTEIRMRRKSGEYLWVRNRGAAVWDENDQPIFMSGSISDISQRKNIEENLRESEELFRKVFEAVASGMVVISTEGIVQKCNAGAAEMFGYELAEVIGRNVSMLMPEPDCSKHDGYLKAHWYKGGNRPACIDRRVMGLHKNGDEFPLRLVVAEVEMNGETCFVGSLFDLSEVESLANQLLQSRKLEAVGQLTGGVAHDFNNLLAVIQGNLSLLEEDLRSGDTVDSLELVQPALEATRRGAELTHRLLAFSRKQMLQPSTQDLNKLIEGMEGLLKRTLGARLDFGVFLQPDNWHAMVDQSQMESVLLNLVLNARDAMIDGGQLIIRTENVFLENNTGTSEDEVLAGDYVMVSVSDSGKGMSSEVTDKAFEPFFTTKEVGKGSGLGLSMIHGFVKQSGGHTVIESQVGEGTTVKLYLPRSKTDEGRAEKSAAASEFDGHGMILVVEDSAEVRRITVRILHRLGYQTLEAEDGKVAMQLLEGGKEIDLLLTDVALPGDMSGVLIAQQAQKAKRQVKVLYMSGYADMEIVDNERMDGKGLLLNKPFSATELAAKVKVAMA